MMGTRNNKRLQKNTYRGGVIWLVSTRQSDALWQFCGAAAGDRDLVAVRIELRQRTVCICSLKPENLVSAQDRC